MKKNQKMSTCNWLDLQTLGSQPIMPKNLLDYCSLLTICRFKFTYNWYFLFVVHIEETLAKLGENQAGLPAQNCLLKKGKYKIYTKLPLSLEIPLKVKKYYPNRFLGNKQVGIKVSTYMVKWIDNQHEDVFYSAPSPPEKPPLTNVDLLLSSSQAMNG